MNKRFAVLKYYTMSDAVFIQRVYNIILKMTGNVHFATPNPTLAVLATNNDAFDAAYKAALQLGLTQKAELRAARQVVINNVRDLRDYVNNRAAGDELIVLSSGFDVSKTAEPVGNLLPPTDVEQVFDGRFKGISVKWAKVSNARGYIIEAAAYAVDQPYPSNERFVQIGTSTACRLNFPKPVGSTWLVRAAAIGTAGASEFSDPAQTVAV